MPDRLLLDEPSVTGPPGNLWRVKFLPFGFSPANAV